MTTEVLGDALPRQKVFLPAAGQRARRSFDDTGGGDGLSLLGLLVRSSSTPLGSRFHQWKPCWVPSRCTPPTTRSPPKTSWTIKAVMS